MSRSVSDEQLAVAVKTWTTANLVRYCLDGLHAGAIS